MMRAIRWFAHQLKRACCVLRILPLAVKKTGGVKALLNKVVTVYRCSGWAGIKSGVVVVRNAVMAGAGAEGYEAWVHRYDTLSSEEHATIREKIRNWSDAPLISVLLPTYNPNLRWLEEAIDSVRGQLYGNWELCIADDASTDPNVRKFLERMVEDPRIKVVFRKENGHISEASNSALSVAQGEWIALLDHDDLLAESALYWVVKAIHEKPDAGLIYSDEDKVDESGRRQDPYFKCDWNPDLLRAQNMISHLGVYRSALVKELGGFRKGFEGSQDHDLALRITERLSPHQIVHIPRILYHWRIHAESTASTGSAKSYAQKAGAKAIQEHLQRQDIKGNVEVNEYNMYRVKYALPDKLPLVTLIIPTRNGLELIRQCVESILEKTTYKNYEIIIVDNGSDDPGTLHYFDSISRNEKIRVIRDDRPFNYSQLNNGAVEKAHGEIIGLINNDIEVITPTWLEEMVSLALLPGVGAVGARLWYSNDTLQHGGVVMGIRGVAGHAHKHLPKGQPGYFARANLIQSYSAVTAACLVVKKMVYEEVGGLNESDLKVAFNDVDFCLKILEAGYRNVWTPYAELYHHESATRGYEDNPEKQKRFLSEVDYMKTRWADRLLEDPAYSPNLTQAQDDFSYAWPPRV